MTREQIVDRLRKNPRSLVHEKTRISLDSGDVVIIKSRHMADDYIWVLLEFVEGENAGKEIWVPDDDEGIFEYHGSVTDYRFLFNGISSDKTEAEAMHRLSEGTGVVDGSVTLVPGGGFFPEWEGKIFRIADEW